VPVSIFDICFEGYSEGYVELSVGGIYTRCREWYPVSEAKAQFSQKGNNIFFGPVLRREPGKMGKSNCWKSQVCWVDIDKPQAPKCIFQPSAIVMSGHGWHYYWMVDSSEDTTAVENANKALAGSIRGDSAHNVDRIMRMPGTINVKEGEDPVPCKLMSIHPELSYSLQTLTRLGTVPEKIISKILTGDQRGYRTESERDWGIIRALVAAGFEYREVLYIFQNHQCGSKFQTDGERYLQHSYARAKERKTKDTATFIEHQNCYHARHRGGTKQVSTFTITPTLLLEGEGEDWIVGDVHAQGCEEAWKDVIFPRSAFSRIATMSKYLTKTDWVWLGSDANVRSLLAYLNTVMRKNKIPKSVSTHVLGYHEVNGHSLYVLNDRLVGQGEFSDAPPIMYVPTGREAPLLHVEQAMDKDDLTTLSKLLPRLNNPEKIWPMLGWTMACPFKPRLHKMGYKFPILNICGSRGSGKTATIQQVLQPLIGYQEASSYDIGTTRFVALSLLGSANCIPVSFSEFRHNVHVDFGRYIRLAYDIGKDARGRADQTTVEYLLSAPFIVDGEDKMDDPAIMERALIVSLSPQVIYEGEPAWEVFQQLNSLDLNQFTLPYLQYTLAADLPVLLDAAEGDMHSVFPRRMPDRIRRNLTVCWLGVLAYTQFMNAQGVSLNPPNPAVLEESLTNVFSYALERAPMAADVFVEYVVNMAAQQRATWPWTLKGGILWFQVSPAYAAFCTQMVRQRTETLSKSALIAQLGEMQSDYMVGSAPKDIDGKRVLAFGVDIRQAHESGLDIPEVFDPKRFTIDF
jgi:hypothetical protein